uniref:Uncharacterized protein n=1 Tax=Triticum urartu TaxID=4572 RepID=A0A8R7QJI7_TRIUA
MIIFLKLNIQPRWKAYNYPHVTRVGITQISQQPRHIRNQNTLSSQHTGAMIQGSAFSSLFTYLDRCLIFRRFLLSLLILFFF